MHECLRRLHYAAATLHLYVHDIRGDAEIALELRQDTFHP